MQSAYPAGETFEPSDVHIIRTLKELRAVTNPIRVRILDGLIPSERTVKQLGSYLSISSNTLYYHVKALERAELVRLTRTAIQSGIQLKYYRSVARYYYLSPTMLQGDLKQHCASAEFVTAQIECGIHELRQAFRVGMIDAWPDAFAASRREARMSLEHATTFRERVEALDAEFQAMSNPDGKLTVKYFVAVFPKWDEDSSGGEE